MLSMEKEYAICYSVNIPLRDCPSDSSEMLTELLFGDACEVMEHKGTWSYIKNKADGYEGWVTTKMLSFIGKEEYDEYNPLSQPVVTGYVSETCEVGGDEHLLLSGGSVLPYYNQSDSTFKVWDKRFYIKPESVEIGHRTITDTARMFLNSPYLWGGKNAFGIDCSGFVQVVYRIHGVQLLRDAREQIKHGHDVSLQDAVPGDIAFFKNSEGKIVHVGILLGDGKIVHASGSVHIDSIDIKGIYSERLGMYTHTLHSVRHINFAV